ncbi:alpha/beta hydrolase, partial [Saccharothrix sp. ST-888]|uniref:alpha/beta hydrolase n=1 Tax=Saccharothrix sp. ST-888 TaxID=1427391 RepID=UPI0005ED0D36
MPLSDVRTADAVRWESLLLSGPGEELHIRVFQAGPAPGGWLVWAHGGSWRSGSVAGWHSACADLARTADATVVGVDYRLAPDHPHPAALEDVLTAMDWAQQQSETPIAVGGDSAGGTIAASAALIWRDRQRPLAAQVLAYPPMDPACRAQSFRRNPEMFPSRAGL